MEHVAKSDDSDNRKLVRAGDIVINSRSDRRGSSGLSPYDGSVSLINLALVPRHGDPKFLNHLIRSYAFQEEFYRHGHGIVADLWTTRYSELKSIQVALPDLATQKTIADFLDRETARIDQLIEKKQGLMESLEEKLNAEIDLVLLGATVGAQKIPVQGDEFVTEIPASWQMRRLKALCSHLGNGFVGPTRAFLLKAMAMRQFPIFNPPI